MASAVVNGSAPTLKLPASSTKSCVEIPYLSLPANASDILDVLESEIVPLAMWLDVAYAYKQQGMINQATLILQEGSDDEIDQFYKDQDKDRILILAALAQMQAEEATKAGTAEQRDKLMKEATNSINRARRVDPKSIVALSTMGFISLLRGENEKAAREFNDAIREAGQSGEEKRNVVALIGKAVALFRLGGEASDSGDRDRARSNYRSSLKVLRHVLKTHPKCSVGVRLGIGHCLARLGNAPLARKAFARVLELDPGNRPALSALAIVSSGGWEGEKKDASEKEMQGGVETLKEACKNLDDSDIQILLQCARHYSLMKEHSRSKELANLAFSLAENKNNNETAQSIRSFAKFEEAKSIHAESDAEPADRNLAAKALQTYQLATRQKYAFTLPALGAAQIYARLNDFVGGSREILKMTKGKSDDAGSYVMGTNVSILDHPISNWLIGALLLRKGDCEAAVVHLEKAAEGFPGEAGIFLDLAQAQQHESPKLALENYERAISILGESDIPVEILNNVAVLTMTLSASCTDETLSRSSDLLQRGLKAIKEGDDLAATLRFNAARVLEKEGKDNEAAESYSSLVEDFPAYTDARLCLARQAESRGDHERSLEMLTEALKECSATDKGKICCQLGTLFLKQKRLPEAKKAFLDAMKSTNDDVKSEDISGGDSLYADVCLGNMYLATAQGLNKSAAKKDGAEARAKREKHLSHAAETFTRILKKENRNLFAANGLGCVLAERGLTNDSKKVFMAIQDAALADGKAIPGVDINLAHTYFDDDYFVKAIQLYENAAKKMQGSANVQPLLYIARAHYDNQQFKLCKETLQKARLSDPDDVELKFNLALSMQYIATSMLASLNSSTAVVTLKLPIVEAATEELRGAHTIFSEIAEATAENRTVSSQAKTHAEFCKIQLDNSDAHIEHYRQEDAIAREGMESKRLERIAAEERRQQVEKEKRAAELAEREKLQRGAEELALKRIEMLENWKNKEAEESLKKKSKGKNSNNNGNDLGKLEEGEAGGPLNDDDELAEFLNDEDDDDPEPAGEDVGEKRKRDSIIEDEEDAPEDDVDEGDARTIKGARIESDDEEDGEDQKALAAKQPKKAVEDDNVDRELERAGLFDDSDED